MMAKGDRALEQASSALKQLLAALRGSDGVESYGDDGIGAMSGSSSRRRPSPSSSSGGSCSGSSSTHACGPPHVSGCGEDFLSCEPLATPSTTCATRPSSAAHAGVSPLQLTASNKTVWLDDDDDGPFGKDSSRRSSFSEKPPSQELGVASSGSCRSWPVSSGSRAAEEVVRAVPVAWSVAAQPASCTVPPHGEQARGSWPSSAVRHVLPCSAEEGGDVLSHSLELWLGLRDGAVGSRTSAHCDPRLPEQLQDLAARLRSIAHLLPPTPGQIRVPDLLFEVSDQRVLLQRREAELLHADAEVARTAARLQQRDVELKEVQRALRKARGTLQLKESRLSCVEAELHKTRRALREAHADAEGQINEGQKIGAHLHAKSTSLLLPSMGLEGALKGCEIVETQPALHEAQSSLRQKESLLCSFEGELCTTRQALHQARFELDEQAKEVQSISVHVREADARSKAEVGAVQSELRKIKEALAEALSTLKEKEIRLSSVEGDLSTTREALQNARVDLDQRAKEVLSISANVREADARAKAEVSAVRSELQETKAALREAHRASQEKESMFSTVEAELSASRQALQKAYADVDGRTKESGSDLTDKLRICREELSAARRDLKSVQMHAERELEDYSNFVRQIADTSGSPALGRFMSVDTSTIIGSGHFGYVLLGDNRKGCSRIAVKLQSSRWIDVAAREWAIASSMGSHPHILGCRQAFLHKDSDRGVERKLEAGFDSNAIFGRKPRRFPDTYICLVSDFMDRGSVQDMIDRRLCDVESLASLVRQIASGLSFLHKQQHTHNDVKPANVLLQSSPNGNGTVVARLADFGLAQHSTARRRDCEMLAYTAWCVGLTRIFQQIPDGEEKSLAVAEFRATKEAGRAGTGSTQGGRRCTDDAKWLAVADVIHGLWQGDMTASDVAESEVLQECELRIPAHGEEQLEFAGREATVRLAEAAASAQARWRKLQHALRFSVMEPVRLKSIASTEPSPASSDSSRPFRTASSSPGRDRPVVATPPRRIANDGQDLGESKRRTELSCSLSPC